MTSILAKAFISERAGLSIIDFLSDETGLSKAKVKDCASKGGVWLQRGEDDPQRIKLSKDNVKLDDEIHIYYDADLLKQKPLSLQQLADFDQYSIWRQPEGVMTTMSLYSDHLMLQSILLKQIPQERDCHLLLPSFHFSSGVLLVAHTRNMAARFQAMEDAAEIERALHVDCFGEMKVLPEMLCDLLPAEHMDVQVLDDKVSLAINPSQEYELEVLEAMQELELKIPQEAFDDRVELHVSLLQFTCPLTGELRSYKI